jgi:alpha-L-fucosidase
VELYVFSMTSGGFAAPRAYFGDRFDGGLGGWPKSAAIKISEMMQRLQPNAVAFQGPTVTNAVRWIGNENGHAAAPNFIASDNSMANGPGHINGSVVSPAEVDTPFATGQSIWWWAPHQTFKSLRELQIEYDNSIGHNANLLLGLTPDFSGVLPTAHVERYTEFGKFLQPTIYIALWTFVRHRWLTHQVR